MSLPWKRYLLVFFFTVTGLGFSFVPTGGLLAQANQALVQDLPDTVPVEEIAFSGLDTWADEDLVELVRQNGLEVPRVYQREELQDQANVALQVLSREGYFSDVQVQYDQGVLRFEVVEYPSIGSLSFEGNDAIGEDQLQGVLLLSPGEPASSAELNRAERQLEEFYGVQGYGQASVKLQVSEPSDGSVDVTFEIDEGTRENITAMEFEHVDDISVPQTVREVWGLRWELPVNVGSPFSPQVIQQAVQGIESWYKDRGFMEVEVVPRSSPDPKGEGMRVVFEIRKGPMYRLGDVSLTGNDSIDEEELIQEVPLEQGDVFNRSRMEDGLQEIEKYYQDRGYAEAVVLEQDRYEFNLDREQQVVNVTANIKEGQPIMVERIDIRGNKRTYDKVIRREVLLEEGELLDGRDRRRTVRRLRRLGFFSNVELHVDPGSEPNTRVVRVEVEEGSTGQLQFGGGFSSSVGFIGNISVSKDNFSLWDPYHGFTGRAQSIQVQAEMGDERQNANISWDDPWFNDDLGDPNEPSPSIPISLGFSGFNQNFNRINQDYEERRRGGSLRTGILFGDERENQVELEYSFRSIQGSDIGDEAPRNIRREAGLIDDNGNPTGSDAESFTRKIGSLEPSIQRDVRDSTRFPTEGYFVRAGVTYANEVLGGNSNYYLPAVRAQHFQPIVGPVFTALRFDYRTLDALGNEDDIPVFEEFFLGGFRDLRGYDFRDIAIRDETDPEEITSGGKSQFFLNAELRFQLIEDNTLQLFGFYDVGNVYDDSWKIDPADLKSSTGVGARIVTPVGPITISWSQRLDETYEGADDAGESEVDFNIGGSF